VGWRSAKETKRKEKKREREGKKKLNLDLLGLFLSSLSQKKKKKKQVDPATGSALVKRGEAELASKSHPDLYTVPYRPGGTLYARNPPVSPELHQQLDFGREGH
jgi:hypothetical protein